jgi:hypothetical protein
MTGTEQLLFIGTHATGRASPREFAFRLPSTANISMQTNGMGPPGPENPQLPRDFADADRTSETAGAAKIGL